MALFESRWDKIAPYVLGILFGLSIALTVSSIFILKRAMSLKEGVPYVETSVRGTIARDREDAIVRATKRVSPAVVSITAIRKKLVQAYPLLSYEWFRRFFYGGQQPGIYEQEYSIFGSGVIVNSKGYILTNEHVVRNAEKVFVTLNDGQQTEAELVGSAPDFDLALLKINASGLPYAAFGNSDSLEIGEWVIAIGSPFGYLLNDTQPTVTVGVVSALHRDIKSNPDGQAVFKNMIQTDAAINPGNSGGPLVSSGGEVIGINTFVFSTEEGGNLGMGFAIPINTAKMVIDEITRYGKVRDVWTGLEVRELTSNLVSSLDLPFHHGLIIERIVSSSPAEEAGLKVGDIIVEVNGSPIRTVNEANRAIFGLRVGDSLRLRIFREGDYREVTLILAERPKRI